MRLALAILALCLPACGGHFEEARSAAIAQHYSQLTLGAVVPRDDAHCKSIDDRHGLFVTAAWVDGSLAGASGAVAGALPGDAPNGWRIGLGAGAAAFAAMAVYATTAASSAATEYVEQCQ